MSIREKARADPRRIVCLTAETTETLYLLGEDRRIVGISGFTVRPPHARKEKPKVSAFTSAKIEKILELKPDLVLGFSELQADIIRELLRAGLEIHVFNQRDVRGILGMIERVGALIGVSEQAHALCDRLLVHVEAVRAEAAHLPRRPRVYFEEWDDPLVSGLRWVSELIEVAGGTDCFPELREASLAKDRVIADPAEVIRRAPDIIIGSWCGKRFRPERVMARPGWASIPAVRDGQVFEIKSALILQPGPAVLSDGLDALASIIKRWARGSS